MSLASKIAQRDTRIDDRWMPDDKTNLNAPIKLVPKCKVSDECRKQKLHGLVLRINFYKRILDRQ